MANGKSGYKQEVIAINTFGLEERQRTSPKTGRVSKRYTVTIKSEPVLGVFDPLVLGKGPAEAIRDIISKKISAISEPASQWTILRRERSARAIAWDDDELRRYRVRGGGTGEAARGKKAATAPISMFEPGSASPPGRLFNDSGLLAAGIHVMENKTEKSWTINVPAARFNPDTWTGNVANMQNMVAKLQQLVPEMGSALALERHQEFQNAINEAIQMTITRADRRTKWGRLTEMGKAYGGLLRSLQTLGKGVLL